MASTTEATVERDPLRPRRAWRPSQQTVTALVSSLVFFGLVMVVALAPVPYVSRAPGRTVDLAGATQNGEPVVRVQGLQTHRLNGELRMTTVSVTSVDARLGLLQALASHQLSYRDVLPRKAVYDPLQTEEEVKATEVRAMSDSKSFAVIAALRAAGHPVKELPPVAAVTISGPSFELLEPGDLIQKVDGTAVQTIRDVEEAVRAHKVGSPVVFTVERGGRATSVTVTAKGTPTNPRHPDVGVEWGVGYQYSPQVDFGIDPAIVGPSAGLVFSLAVYDMVTPDDLLQGRKVAGTGAISPVGTVYPIGGIQEKVRGAEKAGATVFLVPSGNCRDVRGVKTSMELVKVETLRDAITGLQKLKTSKDGAGVPRC